jgi:hypothetical protein
MLNMRRREFLQLSVLASGASFCKAYGFQVSPDTALRLTIDPHSTGHTIAPDFTGLSYETQQLGDPTFFAPDNIELVDFVRRLGKGGVLRIGGNSSEYSYWTPNPTPADLAAASEPVNPSTGKHPDAVRKITPQAIRNLRGFIDATGWKLIYGLNLGKGTPEAAADEAAYVAETLGAKLIAFQLGNEPNLFVLAKLRDKGYSFVDYAAEWRKFHKAIVARVPNAKFAGPDTSYAKPWTRGFAEEFKDEIVLLTQHYYALGPPTDPRMTIERLLTPRPKFLAALEAMSQLHKDTGLPFRMTETNSCYSAGKQGVSNTLASALWGTELMYQLAAAGSSGINFHGGGYGWYTPIAGTRAKGFEARPIYYGMLLFEQAGAGQLMKNTLDQPQPEDTVVAYSLKADAGLRSVVLNKHASKSLRLSIDPGQRAERATVLPLTGPSLDATSGIKLGGSEVHKHADWEAAKQPTIAAKDGKFTLELPAASGCLVTYS